jgi:predicted Fe-Mo cluster-binding NifX family protein
MIIAVTSTGDSPESYMNEHFGRCQYFLIVNSETMQYQAVSNIGENMQNGAGPKAASIIANQDAGVLLTGSVGDKAADALEKSGIKVIDGFKGTMKVKDAVNQFLLQEQHS